MGMMGKPIRLGDIANCEAFIETTLKRSGIRFPADEHEEMLAECLTILYELHAVYRPLAARPGIDARAGRFSGYAAWALPKRAGDAWHKMHPEHRYVTDPDTGGRSWRYGPPMISLNSLTESPEGGDHHLHHAIRLGDFVAATLGATVFVSQQRLQGA